MDINEIDKQIEELNEKKKQIKEKERKRIKDEKEKKEFEDFIEDNRKNDYEIINNLFSKYGNLFRKYYKNEEFILKLYRNYLLEKKIIETEWFEIGNNHDCCKGWDGRSDKCDCGDGQYFWWWCVYDDDEEWLLCKKSV